MSKIESLKKVLRIILQIAKKVIYVLYLGTVLFVMLFIYLMSMRRENMPIWERYDLDVLDGALFIWIMLAVVNIISFIVLLIIKKRIRAVIHAVLAVICVICASRLNYIMKYEVPIYLPYLF